MQTEAQNGEGNLPIHKSCESFLQTRLRPRLAANACEFIDAVAGALTGNVDQIEIIEYFDSSDDRTMRIVNRNRSHPDRDFVSALVMQEPHGFYRFARFHGLCLSAVFTAELASRLAAMQQCFGDTRVSHDFVPKSTRDAFRAIAPKNNSFLHIKYAQSGGEAFQNVRQTSSSSKADMRLLVGG